jgi:hypothetical protein
VRRHGPQLPVEAIHKLEGRNRIEAAHLAQQKGWL